MENGRLDGRVIAEERTRRGLTQGELAAALTARAPAVLGHPLRLGQTQIARLEAGLRPRREVMALLHDWSDGRITADRLYRLPGRTATNETARRSTLNPERSPNAHNDETHTAGGRRRRRQDVP